MTESVLATIRIVLVEPAGALNVGAIARVMKNMGLQHLVLVKPHCDPLGAEARQMAVHAADVLESATIVTTLPEALRGCQRAIATTARPRVDTVLESPRAALPWLLEPLLQANRTANGAILFGPEDRGLSNEELNYAQRFVVIPSHPTYPVLNLAQAVAICCYELYQLLPPATHPPSFTSPPSFASSASPTPHFPTPYSPLPPPPSASPTPHSPLPTPPSTPPAPLDLLDGYYQHLEAMLLAIGYLHPHTASSRMQKFRRLFNRALPTIDEVSMLRGILSQVEWAIAQAGKSKMKTSSTGADQAPTDKG